MAENVRVVVRCRPMNKREHSLKNRNIIKIEDCTLAVENPQDLTAPAKAFTYDSVYGPLEATDLLYQDICYTLVENVLEGYNGTIFAYGQTGCGKTHTMQGPDASPTVLATDVADQQRGIIARSFDHIFEAISLARDVRYLALVSYLEIYNENIRDLLNPNEGAQANHQLKELPQLGVVVPTLSTHIVHDARECYSLLNMGNSNRIVGATLMNAQSSRSHSIFTISLEQMRNENEETSGGVPDLESNIRRGKLNLVDLAGSERQNKTCATGERLKEATKINLSLSALGNVISALVDGKTKHIPYRDSKLTRLLQDSLGGNTKTLMIACISPADSNYDETLSTLRYASRAKNIANKPKINEDPKDAKLREYQEEITKLKSMLQTNHHTENGDALSAAVSVGDTAIEGLQRKMEEEIEVLRTAHAQQRSEKDELMAKMVQLRQHYEKQMQQQQTTLAETQSADHAQATEGALQLEMRQRIEAIKRVLIGGERANDTQLRAHRQKKKLDAQRRLSALAAALGRVAQREDRDLLQVHYTNIQQEIEGKNEYLKRCGQKIRALEREVTDVQAEFQMDRADYLETIRRLERHLRFYQQLVDRALPILRKDGKYWEPTEIMRNATWNDDLKTWRLPETVLNSLKFPPARLTRNAWEAQNNMAAAHSNSTDDSEDTNSNNDAMETDQINGERKLDNNHKLDVLHNYFRTTRPKLSDYKRSSARTGTLTSQQLLPQQNFIQQYFNRPNLLNSSSIGQSTRQPHYHSAAALLPMEKQRNDFAVTVTAAKQRHLTDGPRQASSNSTAWGSRTAAVPPVLALNNTWGGGMLHQLQHQPTSNNNNVLLLPLTSLIGQTQQAVSKTTATQENGDFSFG